MACSCPKKQKASQFKKRSDPSQVSLPQFGKSKPTYGKFKKKTTWVRIAEEDDSDEGYLSGIEEEDEEEEASSRRTTTQTIGNLAAKAIKFTPEEKLQWLEEMTKLGANFPQA